MPAVYNLHQQHGAVPPDPPSGTSPDIPSPSRFFTYSWLGLTAPWLCGAVLIAAVLLYRYRRGKGKRKGKGKGSRGVSMSHAETSSSSTKSPTQMQWSSDDSLKSEKGAFLSSSSTWAPTTTAAVPLIQNGNNHISGTTITTPVKTIFPYPNPPSPTLSPVTERDLAQEQESSSSRCSPSSTTTGTSPARMPTPPRRRSYIKTSTIPLSPQTSISGPISPTGFPITANESEFEFGSDPIPAAAMGIELSEEIIVAAEGWRRHTRVYGGGVCQACLDSEQQMGRMGIKLAEMDA